MGGKKNKVPLTLRIVPWLFPKLEKIAPSVANRFFVYIFFTPFRYTIPEKEMEAIHSSDRFQLIVNGLKIQCYAWGEEKRPVILFVHGWAGRGTQFRKFIKPCLENGYRVILFDGPAHGFSDGRKTNLEEFQDVIQTICKTQGSVEGIITHSFGGAATMYALTKGLQVRSVVNIATPTIGDEIIKTYLRAINGSEERGKYFREYVKNITGKSFDEFTIMQFIQQVPASLNLLLIHDDDDQDVDIRQARELIVKFPTAELYNTKGLGHTRILKDDGVIEKAVTFIRTHSSS